MQETNIIHFDGRCLQDPGYQSSGIGRYAEWLFLRLLASPGFVVRLAVDQHDRYVAELREKMDLETTPLHDMHAGIYFNPSLMTHDSGPLELAKARGLATVGVLHDLIPLRRPVESSEYDLNLFKAMLHESTGLDVVVTNSLFTMKEYRAWRGTDVPMFVLHPESRFAGLTRDFHDGGKLVRDILGIDPPYVFFAVADHPRKNIELAAKVAPALRSLGFATVVGGGISTATIERLARSHDLSAVTFTPRLLDRDLASTYLSAEAVVVPSFDEGFSLPVLEAVGLGCRVLVSDIAAHREQIADARHRFEPDDAESFLEAFRSTASLEGTDHVVFEHEAELSGFLQWLGDRSR